MKQEQIEMHEAQLNVQELLMQQNSLMSNFVPGN